eukprot:Skav219286  [mRNA]  locus=scaffold2157:155577:164438:- [translate_table: standard]
MARGTLAERPEACVRWCLQVWYLDSDHKELRPRVRCKLQLESKVTCVNAANIGGMNLLLCGAEHHAELLEMETLHSTARWEVSSSHAELKAVVELPGAKVPDEAEIKLQDLLAVSAVGGAKLVQHWCRLRSAVLVQETEKLEEKLAQKGREAPQFADISRDVFRFLVFCAGFKCFRNRSYRCRRAADESFEALTAEELAKVARRPQARQKYPAQRASKSLVEVTCGSHLWKSWKFLEKELGTFNASHVGERAWHLNMFRG